MKKNNLGMVTKECDAFEVTLELFLRTPSDSSSSTCDPTRKFFSRGLQAHMCVKRV